MPTAMPATDETISPTLAQGLVALGRAADAPGPVISPLLDALDGDQDAVSADAEWAFWEAAAKERSLRDLAVIGPTELPDGAWDDIETAVRTAPTVRKALCTLAAASDLLHGPAIFHFVSREDGSGALVYESPHTRARDAGALAAEVALATVAELIRRITGDRHAHPESVWLIGRPRARTSSLAHAIGCPVHTGAAIDRMELDRGLLDSEVDGSDPRAHGLAVRILSMERRDRERAHASLGVRRALIDVLVRGEPVIEGLAASLRMRPRALTERLAREEVTVRQLLDESRKRAAEHLLLAGTPPGEVQKRLGYGDPASFRRACRRWWGMGPRARRSLLVASKQLA